MGLTRYDIDLDLEQRQGTSHALLVAMTGANKPVLDVGCDTGYLGEALTAMGCTVDGFEYNESAAEVARTRMRRVEVGDLEAVDLGEVFGAGKYEVVLFGDVLEHLRDPLPVLRGARRLLSPGGSVIISVPNVAHGDVRMALLAGRFAYTKVGLLDDTHTRFFTRDSLTRFLTDAGFVLVDLQRTRADLFSTEVGVQESEVDPAVVDALRRDPEATTYQFVVRAVPDDAVQTTSEQALKLDQLSAELQAARRELTERTQERDALMATLEEREQQLGELRGQLSRTRNALAALRSSRAVRGARTVRRVIRRRRG